MTAPDESSRSPTSAVDAPRRASSTREMLRKLRDRWILHLTLLTLAALFVFPFLWMVE